MRKEIDWSEAPEGFPLWLEFKANEHRMHSGWYRKDGNYFKGYYGAHWPEYRTGQFFNVHYKSEKHLINEAYLAPVSLPQSWSGEGLPPVGTVCELNVNGEDWLRAIIKYQGKGIFVWLWDHQSIAQPEYSKDPSLVKFRPIRTHEQIAADEREAAIKEMTANYAKDSGALAGWAAYVYDTLGYRKEQK